MDHNTLLQALASWLNVFLLYSRCLFIRYTEKFVRVYLYEGMGRVVEVTLIYKIIY